MDKNGTEGSLSNSTSMLITVLDMNDNYPVFEEAIYHFSVYENVWANTQVGQVRAIDKDMEPNNRITYSITDGANGRFFIDRASGKNNSYSPTSVLTCMR